MSQNTWMNLNSPELQDPSISFKKLFYKKSEYFFQNILQKKVNIFPTWVILLKGGNGIRTWFLF